MGKLKTIHFRSWHIGALALRDAVRTVWTAGTWRRWHNLRWIVVSLFKLFIQLFVAKAALGPAFSVKFGRRLVGSAGVEPDIGGIGRAWIKMVPLAHGMRRMGGG